MSYLLSGLDLVVNNTTSIIVNTNPITIQGDIAASENVIAVNNRYNRFFAPDNTPVAVINSTSKATSLINLTAKALGTVNIPVAEPVGGNGLKNLITNYYDSTTYYSPQLLTCLGFNNTSTTIEDLSDNNFTITNNGTAVVSTLAPFSNSYAYASMLFNGTTQYLSVTGTTSEVLNLATNAVDWTVECWFYPTSVTGERTIFWKGGTTGQYNPSYAFFLIGTTGQWIVGNGLGGGTSQNLATVFAINTWYHFALVRTGNILTSYVNGVGGTPVTMSFTMGNTSNNLLTIGSSVADGSTRFFAGNISNFQVVKNVAVYKGNFTPPKNNFLPVLVSTLHSNINTTTYTKLTYEPLNINLYSSLKYSAPTGQRETYDPDLVGNSRINSYLAGNISNKYIKSDTEIVNVSLSPEFYINGPDAPIVLSTEGRGEITTQITGALVFNANLDKLTYAGDPENINISADFTLEFWLKPTSWGQTVIQTVMSNRTEQSLGWCIFKNSDSVDCRRLTFRSTSGTLVSSDVTNNVWQHWALVRSGSTLSWWKNGKIDTSTTSPPGSLLGGTPFSLGTGKTGGSLSERNSAQFEISNLRIIKGTALYASTFTPQVPLSVVANTTFLLPVADSATSLLETVSGSTLTSNSVEFTNLGPVINTSTTTLITPVQGGGSFNGTNQYLTAPIGSSTFGSGDFTAECWFYKTSATACTLLNNATGNADNSYWFIGSYVDGHCQFTIRNAAGQTNLVGTITTALNTWVHVAVVRISGVCSLYINGVFDNSATITTTITARTTNIGSFQYTGFVDFFPGYITNVRLVTGLAVYTGNFTVPTKPLAKEQNAGTNIQAITTQTSLLTLQNPLTLVDNSSLASTINNTGGVTIASTYSPTWTPYATTLTAGGFKFTGAASEYYTLPALNTVFEFGTGDFSIELWVYITKSQTGYIYDTRPTTTQGAYATLYYSSTAGWISYDTDSFSRLTAPVSLNRWYHVAVCRISGITKMYLNGTQSGSSYTSNSSYLTSSSPTNIGASTYTTGAAPFAGQISNLRVVKGLAVYTGNFSVPTSPLTKTQTSSTNISPIVGGFTSLLTAQDGTKLDYSDNSVTISSSVNSITPSVLYGPVLGTVSTAATVNSSPGAYVSTPSINATNIEYINYRTDPRSVNKRVKNLIVGTTGVIEELQSWS